MKAMAGLKNQFPGTLSILKILIIFLLFFYPFSAFADTGGGVNSAKECAMCHINWIDVFYRQGQSTDLTDYPKEKLVANEMMCYSCHDGSVGDSRLRVWETSRHKTGVKPSPNVSVPEEYPLDKEGNIQCATCHSAHGVNTKPGMADTIFLREPNINSRMCKRCHRNKKGGPKMGNHPIDAKLKEVPDKIVNNGGKLGTDNTVICQTCHTPHGSTNEHFLVIPNSKGGLTHSQLCETCHTKKPALAEEDSKRRFSHPVDVPLIEEAKLPDKWDNGKKPYLSYDGRINCITCHTPHNGTKDNHLLQSTNENGKLCVTCHTSKKTIFNTKHDIGKFNPEEENGAAEKAGEKGTCFACHFMHKGNSFKMWARPVSGNKMEDLCFSCHNKEKVAKKALTGEISHPVDVKLAGNYTSISLPFYSDQGEKSVDGKVTCPTCHNVHRWSPDSDDKGEKDVAGDGENSFLRKSAGGESALCRTCHKDKGAILETKHDMNEVASDSTNVKEQDLQKSGVCGACHTPHNAVDKKLWAREPGSGKNIEVLCTSCHADEKEAKKKTTGKESHPLGVIPKAVDDGEIELPLYAEDGSLWNKGSVDCSSCHNVHRWSPVDDEKGGKGVEGNGNNSFLRKKIGKTDDLCNVCHKDKFSVKETKHDLALTAPSSKNANKQTVNESGTCGACHTPHNGRSKKLWSRDLASEEKPGDTIEGLCISCHSEKNVAEGKTTGFVSHPLGKRPNIIPTMKNTLPLFDSEARKSDTGYVTCSTCHNVHKWDPKEEKGPGKRKIEGDRFNSFLRAPYDDSVTLCAACHEEKSLIVGTDHDLNVTAPNVKNMSREKVKDSGICGSCHKVHNAWGNKLWGRAVGTGQNRIEALCTGCHSPRKAAGKKVISTITNHPMNKKVSEAKATLKRETARFYKEGVDYHIETKFPLYDKLGMKTSSGDITCATCHNVHQWDPAKAEPGKGENIEGNGGNSFLRKSNLPESSLCTTCHTEKRYVAKTDHDMSVTAPRQTNKRGETVADSGVCSACHVPHGGAENGYKLWARDFSSKSELISEQTCLSCHSGNGIAANKGIKRFRHPRDVVVSEVTKPEDVNYAPLYDMSGNELQTGIIACPTCHNPHLWQTGSLVKGSGKPEEGNNRNSFLRLKSASNVCKDCHGFEGLMRYKYFHGNPFLNKKRMD